MTPETTPPPEPTFTMGPIELEPPPAPPAAPDAQPPAAPDAPPAAPAAPPAAPDAPAAPAVQPQAPNAPPAVPPNHVPIREVIEERARRRQAEDQVRELTNRLQAVPPAAPPAPIAPSAEEQEVEQRRLLRVAMDNNLQTTNGDGQLVWDTEGAARLEQTIRTEASAIAREIVRQEVEPLRHANLSTHANNNVQEALRTAQAWGLSPEAVAVVKEKYDRVLAMPNGAQMLAQAQLAMEIWDSAIGAVTRQGLMPTATQAAQPPPPPPAIPPLPTTGGPGAGGSTVVLTPAQQAVYQNNGLNPNTDTPMTRDNRGAIIL